MSDIKQRLRMAVQTLRRTSMPIHQISPLLTQSADHIQRLEEQIEELRRAEPVKPDHVNYD